MLARLRRRRDSFIVYVCRYAKANRALTAFETDITRYKELQHDIQSEEGILNLGFIRCGPH